MDAQAIYTATSGANVTATVAAVPPSNTTFANDTSIGLPSLYAGSTDYDTKGVGNITSYLACNSSLSGAIFAAGPSPVNSSAPACLFQFIADAPAFSPGRDRDGFPKTQGTQTVAVSFDLCNSTFDTSISLVNPFSK